MLYTEPRKYDIIFTIYLQIQICFAVKTQKTIPLVSIPHLKVTCWLQI